MGIETAAGLMENKTTAELMLEERKKISRLSRECLKKWKKDSDGWILSSCAFCDDELRTRNDRSIVSDDNKFTCVFCVCPKEICRENGFLGYVGKLSDRYSFISAIPDEKLNKIRKMFQNYIIEEREIDKRLKDLETELDIAEVNVKKKDCKAILQ